MRKLIIFKNYLMYLGFFLLPLGFFGNIGLYLILISSLFVLMTLEKGGKLLFIVMILLVLSTQILVETSFFYQSRFLFALPILLIISRGIILSLDDVTEKAIIVIYVVGISSFSLSVIIDFFLNLNKLPSGLFIAPTLHNWSATLIAVSLPITIHLITISQKVFRPIATLSFILMFCGLLFSLSWVGGLGAIVSLIVLRAKKMTRRCLFSKILILILFAFTSFLIVEKSNIGKLTIRNYSVLDIQDAIEGRIVIFKEGMKLSRLKFWNGWGTQTSIQMAYSEFFGTHTSNLLAFSENFEKEAWQKIYSEVEANKSLAPDDSLSADYIKATSFSEDSRVTQLVRFLPKNSKEFTFSIWARADTSTTISLAIRDDSGSDENLLDLKSNSGGEVIRKNSVAFNIGPQWQRISITGDFNNHPTSGVRCVIFLNRLTFKIQGQNGLYIWGAQLNTTSNPFNYIRTNNNQILLNQDDLSHFHNLFIQVFFEYGFIGIISLLFFILILFWQASSLFSYSIILAFLATQLFDYSAHQLSISFAVIFMSSLKFKGGG